MNLAKVVYLPIEFKAREFDSKILLAVELITRGYLVVIGQQWMLYNSFDRLPPGVILFKSHNAIHYDAMAQASTRGFYTCALEEETMAACTNVALEKCSTVDLYKHLQTIFVHGDFERRFHEARDPSKMLSTVGNPRVDLLREPYRYFYLKKKQEIKRTNGDYILINSNFGLKNSIWGGSIDQLRAMCIKSGMLNPRDPQSIKDFDDLLQWELKCAEALSSTIAKVCQRFPAIRIIVRPHPGEAEDKVMAQYKSFPHVLVRREGNHLPWTLGSQILLHCSCTTGLEAVIADRDAISLTPHRIWYSDSILSNLVNANASDADEVIDLVARSFNSAQKAVEEKKVEVEEKLKPYIVNTSGAFSAKLIANFLDQLNYSRTSIQFYKLPDAQRHPATIKKCSFEEIELENTFREFCQINKSAGFPNPEGEINFHKLSDSLFLIAPRTAQS